MRFLRRWAASYKNWKIQRQVGKIASKMPKVKPSEDVGFEKDTFSVSPYSLPNVDPAHINRGGTISMGHSCVLCTDHLGDEWRTSRRRPTPQHLISDATKKLIKRDKKPMVKQ